MAEVDLQRLTRGEVRMLTGQPRGVSARAMFHLDELDASQEPVTIIAPDDLDTVTPSFVQGFLAESLTHLGPEEFKRKFDLDRLPSLIKDDFCLGIERLMWLSVPPRSRRLVDTR